ncbi:MAG TPA: DUF6308 family protein [Gemmataceae bacterium]|jgi:hypothetical protein|nr:DUF6308 family protein [Gemmataceae bacterium]
MIALVRHPLCQALAELGGCHPSMRFGQLVAVAASLVGDGRPGEVEEVEDAAVVEAAKRSVACRLRQLEGPLAEPDALRSDMLHVFDALAARYPALRFGQLAARVAEGAYTNLYDIEDELLLVAARTQLESGGPLPSVSYAVTFPHVIRPRLKYVHQMNSSDYVRVTVPDGRDMIRWYFEAPSRGRKYEEGVQSTWNRASPNALTKENLVNARNARSQGWSYEDVKPLLSQSYPELERIPPEADLLETNRYDADAIQLLERFLVCRGLKVANVSKLFYQKRPRLIPILDDFVRRAMNIPYLWDDESGRQRGLKRLAEKTVSCQHAGPALQVLALWLEPEPDLGAFGLGFRQFRHYAGASNNARALESLMAWIAGKGSDIDQIPKISRLRILDILAWGTVRHMRSDLRDSQMIVISEEASERNNSREKPC